MRVNSHHHRNDVHVDPSEEFHCTRRAAYHERGADHRLHAVGDGFRGSILADSLTHFLPEQIVFVHVLISNSMKINDKI